MVVINPYVILGTSLNAAGAENPSLEIIQRINSGAFPGIFNFHFGIVDVADVATAHLLAMTSPNAKGRYVCVGGSVPMKRMVHVLQHHFPQYPINTMELDGTVGTAALKLGSYFEARDVGQYMRSNVGQVFEYDVSKIKSDLGMEFRSTDETLQASVRTLVKFGKLPAMESQLSPVAVAQIARELHDAVPGGVIGGGDLLSWLIERSQHQLCPTRAVRDAELLQKIGVIVSNKQIGSILPSNPAKMLAVNVVEEAAKLGQFSIIFSAAPPLPQGVDAQPRGAEVPLPAEYQAVVEQTLAELLEAASTGIAEGWVNVKTEMGVTIQRRKNKTTVFKGTTGIKYAAQAIQEQAPQLESMSSIDPLFQEGVILKKLDDTADIRLIKYEGRSCLIVSDLCESFFSCFSHNTGPCRSKRPTLWCC